MILFNQETKFIIRGFSLGDFIQYEKRSEKVELKENYSKLNYFFTRKVTRADFLFLKTQLSRWKLFSQVLI